MMRPRVFVSSIIEGYEAFREAAAEGIRRAGCDPVRAEDFAASSTSPRNACLDGIRSADAVILLLGSRYGWIAPSGASATEEEYNEARRTNKRIFVFLEDVASREPRQEDFVQKVQDYTGGHWRKVYSEPRDLIRLIPEAISAEDLISAQTSEHVMTEKLTQSLLSKPPESPGIVWLKIVWSTLRDEEVTDPLLFGDPDFQRTVMRLGHESDPPLFDYEQCKTHTATLSSLRVNQGNVHEWRDGRDLVILELKTNGLLSIAQNISGVGSDTESRYRLSDMYCLDPIITQERLARAWAFSTAWWENQDPYLRHDLLIFGVVLHDVGARCFKRPEASSTGGITIPPECPHNPLMVFDTPQRLSRQSMKTEADRFIERIIRMIAMRFREWEGT